MQQSRTLTVVMTTPLLPTPNRPGIGTNYSLIFAHSKIVGVCIAFFQYIIFSQVMSRQVLIFYEVF